MKKVKVTAGHVGAQMVDVEEKDGTRCHAVFVGPKSSILAWEFAREQQRSVARRNAYRAIDSERDYQDHKFSVERTDREATDRSLDEFILYIQQYAAEAGALTTHEDEDEALEFVRKIGALCVGCMEQNGAPLRVIQPEPRKPWWRSLFFKPDSTREFG